MKISKNNSYNKNDQTFHLLHEQIRSGALRPGERLPAERLLAEQYHCSRVTIRTALERLEALQLIERVRGSGTYVTENQLNLGGRRLALVLRSDSPDFAEDPYFNQLLPGFYAAASAADYAAAVLVVRSDEDLIAARKRLQWNLTDYSGLVVQYALTDAEIDFLRENGRKVVALAPGMGERSVSHVDIDNYQGSYMATRHLLELDYHRPVFLNGPEAIGFNHAKQAGFEKALREFHITFQPEYMIRNIDPTSEKDAARHTGELLQRADYRFDCMIVYGDWATWGAVKTLIAHGLRIPEDVAVLMYDDFPWVARVLDLPLTVVRQPFSDQIETAVRLLVRQLQNPDHATTVQIIQPSLIVRKSSGITLNRNAY